MKLTYGKSEKLKSKKSIELLFDEGNSVASFPLRFIYIKETVLDEKSRIGVSVSKRKVPNAVDRNRIKRLLRESYRLNQELFSFMENKGFIGMFLFVDKKEWPLNHLNGKMKKIAAKLQEKIELDKIKEC